MPSAAKPRLPLGEQGRDLADGTPDAVRVEPAGDAADVRQVAQRAERAAAEVEAVELHLGRGVGERQPADQRAQRGGLAALRRRRPRRRARPRRPSCSHITSRSCSRGLSTSAIGTCRAPCSSGLAKARPRTGSATTGPSSSSRVGRLVQRRQPHLVGRRALAGRAGRPSRRARSRRPGSPRAWAATGLAGFGRRRRSGSSRSSTCGPAPAPPAAAPRRRPCGTARRRTRP